MGNLIPAIPSSARSRTPTLPWILGSFSVPMLLAATLLVSFALRLYCLDCHGLWHDEVQSLEGASLGFPGLISGRAGWVANQTPLHYLLVWLSTLPVDPRETTIFIRLPQALAGALTPLVVYKLGQETIGRAQGLLAAVLMALSTLHLSHSQDARPYALMVFLCTLSLYSLVKAERTGSLRWWVTFAVVSGLNVLNSYIVLTIFMPALAPYLAWLLWKLWRERAVRPARSALGPYVVALLFVVAICALAYLDMRSVRSATPDLYWLPPLALLNVGVEVITGLVSFPFDRGIERALQLGLLLLAVGGGAAALYDKEKRRYAALFLLVTTVPALFLAVLSPTVVVLHRYALFALPTYLLLASQGLFFLLNRANAAPQAFARRAVQVIGLAAIALIVVASLWSAFSYHTPTSHKRQITHADFRGIAGYLAQQASQEDLIVFVDEPSLGYTTTGYYLRERFPAPAYDARDPLLYKEQARGDIYWILSAENLPYLGEATVAVSYSEIARFNRVLVLRESGPRLEVAGSVERVVGVMRELGFRQQVTQTLQGTIHQARGELSQAVAAYRSAGAYYPLADENIRTSLGFEAHGDAYRSWREAINAKFFEPDSPNAHRHLAIKLKAGGYSAESQVEELIANALRP